MSLPRILIPTRQYERKEMMVQFVGEYHLRLVLQHGLMPIMLPSMPEMMPYLEDELATAAGLLLMEGKDIDPTYYPHTAESLRWVRSTSPERDEIELKLLELALAQRIPIFGICRGSQLLNIACGGDLYTDVHNDRPERSVMHIDYDDYHNYRHGVNLVEGGRLARLYGQASIPVNSYHHQSVKTLAPRFEPLAYAEDGVLEAFHDPTADFVLGLQFHPERMQSEHPAHVAIFGEFAAAVRRYEAQSKALSSSG